MEEKIYTMQDIEKIIESFDFPSVKKIFEDNRYTWYNPNSGKSELPDIHVMKKTCEYLLGQVIISQKMPATCATGRFCAYKFDWGLKLAFEPINKTI